MSPPVSVRGDTRENATQLFSAVQHRFRDCISTAEHPPQRIPRLEVQRPSSACTSTRSRSAKHVPQNESRRHLRRPLRPFRPPLKKNPSTHIRYAQRPCPGLHPAPRAGRIAPNELFELCEPPCLHMWRTRLFPAVETCNLVSTSGDTSPRLTCSFRPPGVHLNRYRGRR